MQSFKNLYLVGCFLAVSNFAFAQLNVDQQLKYCSDQALKTMNLIPKQVPDIPRNINPVNHTWRFVNYKDWCSGFWPGILWYSYEATGKVEFKLAAEKFDKELIPLSLNKASDHDLGFQFFCSFGNGYRLTKDEHYKKVLLATADTLATLYHPKVGTILSWPGAYKPNHNTIIDNMINLELLFWAAKNGGSKRLKDIAVSHALKTMKNHFREDYSAYHVVIYDKDTGKKIKGITHQGYSDSSMWARGQAWAIYGFTMCYRETGNKKFLKFAQKVSEVYLNNLPAGLIPYWDFNDLAIPNAPYDASAAAITASALLELSTMVKDKLQAQKYRLKAEEMLIRLSSADFQSRDRNSAFLLHSTGHKPNNSEIDTSIIYADYYYLEALLRLKKLRVN